MQVDKTQSLPLPSYMADTASRSMKSRRDSPRTDRALSITRTRRFGRNKNPEMPAGKNFSTASRMQETSSTEGESSCSVSVGESLSQPCPANRSGRRTLSAPSGRAPRHRRALADAALYQHLDEKSLMASTQGPSMLQQESPPATKTAWILSQASKLHGARPSYFVRSSFLESCEANGVSLPTYWHLKQSPAVLREGIDDVTKGAHLVGLANDTVGRLESKRRTMQKTRMLLNKHHPKILSVSAMSSHLVSTPPEEEMPMNRGSSLQMPDVIEDTGFSGSDPCI